MPSEHGGHIGLASNAYASLHAGASYQKYAQDKMQRAVSRDTERNKACFYNKVRIFRLFIILAEWFVVLFFSVGSVIVTNISMDACSGMAFVRREVSPRPEKNKMGLC